MIVVTLYYEYKIRIRIAIVEEIALSAPLNRAREELYYEFIVNIHIYIYNKSEHWELRK